MRSFDSGGRLASATDPLGRASSLTYDNRSRLATAQSPTGTETFTYDAAGNLTGNSFSDGTNIQFSYDDDNNLLSGPGLAFTYDGNGRLTSSNGILIARNGDGRVSSFTFASGKAVTYTYDSRGLVTAVADWLGGTTTLAYNDAHQVTSITRPNGTNTKYAYDQDGRISGITESGGSSIAIKRDAAGKETSITRSQPQTAQPVSGTQQFKYDAAHQNGAGKSDGSGRLLKDNLRTYNWNLASELVSYQGADGSASATYDGFGQRISSTSGGNTANYILNYGLGLASISIVRDANGKELRYYIHLPSGVLLYFLDAADNSRHYYHFDEVGSTTFLTNDSGAVTDSYGITPYGELVTPGANNTTNNPFTWIGAYGVMQEGSTSLFYMRARWYDSASARFLTTDPVGSLSPEKINPYQYASANPIALVDPLGLDDALILGLADPLLASDSNSTPGLVPNSFWSELTYSERGLIAFAGFTPPANVIPTFTSIIGAPTPLVLPPPTLGGVPGSLGNGFDNVAPHNIPGYAYNTERSFDPIRVDGAANLDSSLGTAAFGNRILLRFNNIGAGVRLILPGVVSLTAPPAAIATPPSATPRWTGGYLVLVGPSDLQANAGAFSNYFTDASVFANFSPLTTPYTSPLVLNGFRTGPSKLNGIVPPPIIPSDTAARLRQAGAVILGKTNLSEFANFRGPHD